MSILNIFFIASSASAAYQRNRVIFGVPVPAFSSLHTTPIDSNAP